VIVLIWWTGLDFMKQLIRKHWNAVLKNDGTNDESDDLEFDDEAFGVKARVWVARERVFSCDASPASEGRCRFSRGDSYTPLL
jgi:hypothetical protein